MVRTSRRGFAPTVAPDVWGRRLLVAGVWLLAAAVAVGASRQLGVTLPQTEDQTLRALTHYGLKLLVSVLLAWVAFTCLTEVYRLWFVSKTVLSPVTYTRDGAEAKDAATVFNSKVHHDLALLDRLFDQPHAQPKEAGTAVAAGYKAWAEYLLRSEFGKLAPPELQGPVLQNVELQVQGVNVSSLVRTFSQWIHPPREFAGVVSERSIDQKKEITASVQLQHAPGGRAAGRPRLYVSSHPTADEASFAVACHVYYLLVTEQKPDVKYSAGEFLTYCQALRLFEAYRSDVEARRKDLTAAQAALVEADRLLTGLVGDNTRLVAAYFLAGLVKLALKSEAEGVALLGKFVDLARGTPLSQQPAFDQVAAAVKAPATAVDPRQRFRPIRPGVSISSGPGAGTLCCVVRDKANQKLAVVGPLDALDLKPGVGVIQPAEGDNGNPTADRIGVVGQVSPAGPQVAAVRIDLDDPAGVNPEALGVGKFTGTAKAVVGEKVRMVGRTSGVVAGAVTGVDAAVVVGYGKGPGIQFTGVIACTASAGGALSQPGDSGAPVVNDKGQLIGMLFAGSPDVSYLIPIDPLLAAFNAELVTELPKSPAPKKKP